MERRHQVDSTSESVSTKTTTTTTTTASSSSSYSCASWRTYVDAMRPWSFSASITPVALGTALAWTLHAVFSPCVLLGTATTALCVHAAGNLVNTYYDFAHGVDTVDSDADDRTLVDGRLRPVQVERLATGLYAAAFVGFLSTCALSTPGAVHALTLIFALGMSSSFLYTGGLGLKYLALGELLIFVTFGPLTVLFAFVAQCGGGACGGGAANYLYVALYAAPLALNTVAMLHANNARDARADHAAGVLTLAVLARPAGAWLLMLLLLFAPYAVWALLGLHCAAPLGLPLASIHRAFAVERAYRVPVRLRSLPQQLAQLNLLSGGLYVVGVLLTPRDHLPLFGAS